MTQASLTASRISGVAPLAIHFDATGTTDSLVGDPFRELRYDFNFGDVGAGAWVTSGKSKNTESGAPLAAHVYDSPGTYTVTLNVGNATAIQAITVSNPDEVWAGSDTVCLSTSGDFAGAPDGASMVVVTRWPIWESNKRYMLRAGDNFTALGQIKLNHITDMRVDTYGSGAQPLVGNVKVQDMTKTSHSTSGDPFIQNVDVIGLSMLDFSHEGTGRNLLLYRNTIRAGGEGDIRFTEFFQYFINEGQSNMYTPHLMFVIENVSINKGYGANTSEGQMIWMGNTLSHTAQHNIRWWQSYKSIFSHNDAFGYSTAGGKAIFKLHASGLNTITDLNAFRSPQSTATLPASSYNVIANNTFNSPGSTNMWNTLSLKPQDSVAQEGIEHTIAEYNTHVQGASATVSGVFAGRSIACRGEIRLGGIASPDAGSQDGSLPAEWRGAYFIDMAIPPAPDGSVIPPIDPPIECPEGYELIDGECVEIPPIDPPTEPRTCVDGAQGVQGIQGIQGVQGLPGADGNDAEMDPLMDEALDFYDYVKAYFTQ